MELFNPENTPKTTNSTPLPSLVLFSSMYLLLGGGGGACDARHDRGNRAHHFLSGECFSIRDLSPQQKTFFFGGGEKTKRKKLFLCTVDIVKNPMA